MRIVTYTEARAQGLTRYFTGEPCRNGHIAERLTSGRGCIGCKQAQERTYKKQNPKYRRKYYADNKDRLNAKARTPEHREKRRKFYAENQAKRAVYTRRYYWKNAERIRQRERSRRQRITDLLAVLRQEMPDLMKEFGL